MPSIHFRFKINKSFLSESTHPITVPKSQVSYAQLTQEELHYGELTVIFPKGEHALAQMYCGEAGYGTYYQLRFHGGKKVIPTYLKHEDIVFIVLVRMRRINYAILELLE
jgi:hypothetical protein